MDTRSDAPNLDRSVQMVWSLDDRLSGNPRSYTCSFCKKRFSNAQALGGHMNIHRKDRAKLRVQSADETMLSLDIGMRNHMDHSHDFEGKDEIILESRTDEGKSSSSNAAPTRSCSPPNYKVDQDASILHGKAAMEEVDHQQLPLFLKATSTGDYDRDGDNGQTGLDLELRLGLEAHQETTTTTTTKTTIEFFLS